MSVTRSADNKTCTIANNYIRDGTLPPPAPTLPPPPTLPPGVIAVTGYVTDLLCWNNDRMTKDDPPILLMQNPELHSVKCMLEPECITSGYALLTKLKSNSNLYSTYCSFDAASNSKVEQYLRDLQGVVDEDTGIPMYPARKNVYVSAPITRSSDNKTCTLMQDLVDLAKPPPPPPTPSQTEKPLSYVQGFLADFSWWQKQ
eukprot:PhF_6_TR636/c0_g1_i2/m.875